MIKFLAKYLEELIASIAGAVMVTVVIVNVALRYLLGFSLEFAEELSVSCFIWLTFMGASACFKRKIHIGIEALVILLPKKIHKYMAILIDLFLLILCLSTLTLSSQYTFTSNKPTAVLGVSYIYINLAVTLAFFLMSIHSFRILLATIRTKDFIFAAHQHPEGDNAELLENC